MKNTPHLSCRESGDLKQLLDNNEAAIFLGVKPNTLPAWRFHKRYPLPFIKVGRSIRYRRADLEAFLDAHTVNPVDLDAE